MFKYVESWWLGGGQSKGDGLPDAIGNSVTGLSAFSTLLNWSYKIDVEVAMFTRSLVPASNMDLIPGSGSKEF